MSHSITNIGSGPYKKVTPEPLSAAGQMINDNFIQLAGDISTLQADVAGLVADAAALSSGKADKVSSPVTGHFAGLDAGGNLTDSGHKHSDYALAVHTHAEADVVGLVADLAAKAAKVTSPVAGNFAGLSAGGDLVDSGHKHSDYALITHTHAAGDIASGTIATARLGSGAADNTKFLRGDQTWQSFTTGTVTSVGLSLPSWLTVAGSPITASGTLAVSATTGQLANHFLATPDGATGAVILRSIVAADIPSTLGSTTFSGDISAGGGAFTVDGSGNLVAADGSFTSLSTTLNTLDDGTGSASIAGTLIVTGSIITNGNINISGSSTASSGQLGVFTSTGTTGNFGGVTTFSSPIIVAQGSTFVGAMSFQNSNGAVLETVDTNNNTTINGSNFTFGNLAVPTGASVSPQGAAGATTYGYRVSSVNVQGETNACATVTTATGNASLTTSNFNRISWTAVPGATSYKVYGRTSGSELLIASVSAPTVQYDDKGSVTPSGALPGNPAGTKFVAKAWANQTGNVFEIQNSAGTVVVAGSATGNFSASTFSGALNGNASLATNLNGSNIASGTVSGLYLPPISRPSFVSGRIYSTSLVSGTYTTAADTVYYFPIYAPAGVTITKIGCRVGTGLAGSNAKIGLYSESSGAPGTLLAGGTAASTASNGTNAEVTVSVVTTGTWYWIAIQTSGIVTLSACGNNGSLTGLLTYNDAGLVLSESRSYASGLPTTPAPAASAGSPPWGYLKL